MIAIRFSFYCCLIEETQKANLAINFYIEGEKGLRVATTLTVAVKSGTPCSCLFLVKDTHLYKTCLYEYICS